MSDPTVPQGVAPGSDTAGRRAGIAPPLDPSLYRLDDEEVAFFKQQTGIDGDEGLREHIMKVQTEAYELYPYPCIRRFGFTQLKISRLPVYDDILKLGKERDAILLDIGCCFGNDVRKAIADGYPPKNVIASDVEPAFWQLGHRLFKTSPESFQVPFIGGDAFDPTFLQPAPPAYAPLTTSAPALSSVTSLTMLQGRVSAIHASSLFHLFEEEKQLALARALAGLLAPHRGAMLFGSHGGAPEKGIVTWSLDGSGSKQVSMFCHSPESWREMWELIFGTDKVQVDTELQPINSSSDPLVTRVFHLLVWSVKRL